MYLFVIFGIVMVLTFGAIVAAFILMNFNKKKQDKLEEVYVRGEIIKMDTTVKSMSNDPRNSYDHSQYFIEFKTDQSKTLVLTCTKKIFHNLLTGFYGDFVYKGTKLISFKRLEGHEEARILQRLEEEYFFVERAVKNHEFEFYCDAPSLNIKISSDQPEYLDVDEVENYINRMFENKEENFFGLDNKKMVIQFFNDGTNDEVVIDIPDVEKNGSHQAIIFGVQETINIVRAYYKNDDVFELAEFEFMQF